MQLALFTSVNTNPISTEVTKLVNVRKFDYSEPYSRFVEKDTSLNGDSDETLF